MIQERTGAQIQIPHSAEPGQDVRMLSITHPNEQGAQQCASMITDILESKKNHINNNQQQQQQQGPHTTVQVLVRSLCVWNALFYLFDYIARAYITLLYRHSCFVLKDPGQRRWFVHWSTGVRHQRDAKQVQDENPDPGASDPWTNASCCYGYRTT